MARPLLIPYPENATIEELKQVSRVGSTHGYISDQYRIQCSYETVVRFFHKQGYALKTPRPWPDKQDEQLRQAFLQKLEQPMYLPPYSPDINPIERIWLTMKARWFNNHVCKNEEKLSERLDQAILDVINNPKKTQKTTAIGTLF